MNEELKHTPGPWKLFVEPRLFMNVNESVPTIQTEDETTLIAIVTDAPEEEANVRLIAAAPDLLEVCEKAYKLLSDSDDFRITDEAPDMAEELAIAINKVKP